ncbi:hypothetical protein BKA65DRAFT_585312 [Rhexocercosporidium sp. MPI-PUGE-AT-0058]|nr:hypothetical protein BKA65DRAFT_585312 [Rhexocercosporidium sp. MPI-PUGE-AT-0058]
MSRCATTLDDHRIEFKVSSHALSFASPVWKKFIFPQFPRVAESSERCDAPAQKKARAASPDPDHILDFTEDRPDALLILLQITHLQFAVIPKTLPYKTLHGVAVLCDQYDCRKLVRPWLADWLREEWNESNMPGQEGWLFISWCFGRYYIFKALAMTCVLQASLGNDGECMIDGAYQFPHPSCGRRPGPEYRGDAYPFETEAILLPLGIVETILETRQQTIELTLDAVYEVIQNIKCPFEDNDVKHNPSFNFRCEAARLGSIVKRLQAQELWPRPGPGKLTISIHDLLKLLRYHIEMASRSLLPEGHENCYPQNSLWLAATHAISNLSFPVPDSHTIDITFAGLEVGIID